MSFFATRSTAPRYRYAIRRRRGLVLGVAFAAFVAVTATISLPSPYVIDMPGPVFNTIGTTSLTTDGTTSTVPVIEVSGAKTYPTSGELNLLTVSQWGTPESEPSVWQVLQGWFDPTSRVLPIDAVYPPGTTAESTASENAAAMTDSQQTAVAAALIQLGYSVPQRLVVAQIVDGSHAAGVLAAGDVILSVNGKSVSDTDQILALAKTASEADPLTVAYERDGVTHTADIAPLVGADGVKRLGVSVTLSFDFPVDVTINLQDVGGPSAGMMFALGVIDTMTPGELGGGANISGTGTIAADGTVGAIGGIAQKMVAAARAGSTLFLAPADNCDEVVGNIPSGLAVVKVSTLGAAVDAVTTYASTGSAAGLPTCE